MKDILLKRFLRYNHPKYHKYALEWVNNVLAHPNAYNLEYFFKESKHYI